MKEWLVAIAALWPAECSSDETNKDYYRLSMVQSDTRSTTSQNNRLLWTEQVAVPDYLAGNDVVYQTGDVKYAVTNNNLWASLLGQQLRNTLIANPSTQLPSWVVASQPLEGTQGAPSVIVTEFNGRYDSRTIVSDERLLNHQGQLIKRPFRLERMQTQDGYDEMVKVLASIWSQEATSITQEVKRLP